MAIPNLRSASDDLTVPIPASERAGDSPALYRLRAAAARISAECERLLGELDAAGPHDAWRDAIGKSLLASRQLRSLIDRERVSLGAVRSAMHGPRQKILDAVASLLALIPTSVEEEMILQDARAIRDIALGLSADAPDERGGHAASSSPLTSSPADRVPARILVADDEDVLRRNLSRLLERLGYATILAKNGRDALERAEQDLPDLIITDLSMPELSGHELLARLKATPRTQHIPVIVVSGDGDIESVVRCLEHGAEDHLLKPYETVVLQARIRASLERKRMRDLELAYLRRVALLTSAAEAVERQAYDARLLDDVRSEPDQLGQLARVFDRMVNGMRNREAQLESRVRQLRREIAETREGLAAAPAISAAGHFAVGDSLAGRYQIKRELGKGGMGVVYLARDHELDEDVAIKVVRRDIIGEDPTLLERLKSEMRLARRISHRNVVRSHDLGEWEGAYFLSMEYITGTTVAELIASHGRLSLESTLAIATQLADALAVAHEAEIIHRDIKPGNLLVDQTGTLKVTDFGLARPARRSNELTQAGLAVGTPRYMSPEQLTAGDVDARTDLFATGVVLYECLSGQLPFDAETPAGLIAQMLAGPPVPLRRLVPSVPGALESLIGRLLQREQRHRLASARQLADELTRIG